MITNSIHILKNRPQDQGHALCKLVGCIDWFFITFRIGVGHRFLDGYGYENRNLVQHLLNVCMYIHMYVCRYSYTVSSWSRFDFDLISIFTKSRFKAQGVGFRFSFVVFQPKITRITHWHRQTGFAEFASVLDSDSTQ